MEKSILNRFAKSLYLILAAVLLFPSEICWGVDLLRNEASQSLSQDVVQDFLHGIGLSETSEFGYETIHEVIETLHEAPEILEELVHVPESVLTTSPFVLGGLIFILTFLIEEVAIAASAYFVGMGRLENLWAFLSLYMGIFFSDLFLYGLGVVVHKSRWIRSYVDINFYQTQVRKFLNKGLWVAIVVARVVPGMLIPIFLMLGFSKTDLRKVSFVNLFITGVYSVVAFYLLLFLGLKVSDFFGSWSILILIALLAIFLLRDGVWRGGRVHWKLMRVKNVQVWPKITHRGMPSLSVPRSLTLMERLPYFIIYVPIYFFYFLFSIRFRSLSAPTFANPGFENSGICGESKSKILNLIPEKYSEHKLKFLTVRITEDVDFGYVSNRLLDCGIDFPLIAKPDVGYMSRGVELLKDGAQLFNYLKRFPIDQSVILQEYENSDCEAGIFYSCYPGKLDKPTINLSLTYFPFIVGDGINTVTELLEQDPRFAHFQDKFDEFDSLYIPNIGEIVRLKCTGSAKDGCIHKSWPLSVEDPLWEKIKNISQDLPEFWVGRYDVKFKDLKGLILGHFKILEVNGASGEDLTAWDPQKGPFEAYKILLSQLYSLFKLGVINKKRGHKSVSGLKLFKAYIEQESLLFRIASAKLNKSEKTRYT